MKYYDIVIWSEIIQIITYNNYDGFQHLTFICNSKLYIDHFFKSIRANNYRIQMLYVKFNKPI
jgi:hypothetical protein